MFRGFKLTWPNPTPHLLCPSSSWYEGGISTPSGCCLTAYNGDDGDGGGGGVHGRKQGQCIE
jgi:hypothetical protein